VDMNVYVPQSNILSKEGRNFLKKNYPKEYDNFLKFKAKVKNKTPNIKDLIFQWLEGKKDIPKFELFMV